MTMKVVVSNVVRVEDIPDELARAVFRDLTLPNPEYVTRQRLGKWLEDVAEEICLARYDESGAVVLPRGYFNALWDRLKDSKYEYEIENARLMLPSLGFRFQGALRNYQSEALSVMTKFGSGVLVAPCGSGKTALGMALIAHWKQPALVLVHTRELVRQTCKAAKEWLGVEPGVIADGNWEIRDLTVATVQTLFARGAEARSITDCFGLVLQDEVHHAPANTFMDVVQRFPAALRYGLTATPKRADGLMPFMEAVIGPIRHTITPDDLKLAGVLVTPRIAWVRSDFRAARDFEWVDLISALTNDQARNEQIVEIIVRLIDEGRRIIALSERVDHAETIARRLTHLRPGLAVAITGKIGKRQRKEVLEMFSCGEARVLCGTKLADEGLDIPNADALVLMTPSRDASRTMQRVGRILRSVPGKPAPAVYDVVDAHVGMLINQARTRFFECYQKLDPGCRLPEWLERSKRRAA